PPTTAATPRGGARESHPGRDRRGRAGPAPSRRRPPRVPRRSSPMWERNDTGATRGPVARATLREYPLAASVVAAFSASGEWPSGVGGKMSRPNPQLPRRSLVVAVASVVSLLGVLAISPVPATAASNPFPHDAR